MKVLIAEDDAVLRRLLQKYLEKYGHEIIAAKNGAEAWERFQEEEFQLVITDWMMPECTGVELLRRIRAHDRPGYVYVILLTSRSEKEDILEGMDAGADDFVPKPFDQDELRVRLRAGERILQLEEKLTRSEQQAGQRESAPTGETGRVISELAGDLDSLERDSLAALALLEKYRAGRYTLMRTEPELAAEAAQLEDEADFPAIQKTLADRFHQARETLRQIYGQ